MNNAFLVLFFWAEISVCAIFYAFFHGCSCLFLCFPVSLWSGRGGREIQDREEDEEREEIKKKVEIYFLQQCSGLKFGGGRGGVGEMH